MPGLPGSTQLAGYFSLPSGRFGIQAQGPLDVDATGNVKVNFAVLFDDLGGPEAEMLIKEVRIYLRRKTRQAISSSWLPRRAAQRDGLQGPLAPERETSEFAERDPRRRDRAPRG